MHQNFVTIFVSSIPFLYISNSKKFHLYTENCNFIRNIHNINCNVRKGKGKVIPLQARCGPEGG